MYVATVFIIGGNKSWWKMNKGQHHKGRHALFESLIPHSKNMHHTVFFLSFPLCKHRGVLLLADPSKFASDPMLAFFKITGWFWLNKWSSLLASLDTYFPNYMYYNNTFVPSFWEFSKKRDLSITKTSASLTDKMAEQNNANQHSNWLFGLIVIYLS